MRALLPHASRPSFARCVLVLSVLVAVSLPACSRDELPEGTRLPASAEEIAPPPVNATPVPSRRARGLWVLAEGSVRVLDDPGRIEPLLARAERLDATDLFVQVYRGGRVFYHGPDFAEHAPSVRDGGPDVLRMLIEAAHARGLRVHAWVNVLSLSTRRDARMIGELGSEIVLVDRRGRSLLDYPGFEVPPPDGDFYRMGTKGLYLDPALPSVRERTIATFRDLVERYPSLDGLHLDYIRHPGVLPFIPGSRFGVGLDFGYGAATRALYRVETGNPDPIEGAAPGTVRRASDWDDWQRDKVTSLVEEIAGSARAARPGLVVSAAVIAYVDRAYLSLAQDWRRWLESGALDLAMPMSYTLDDRLLRYQLESYAGWPQAERVWPGLGTWLFDGNPPRALEQLEILRRLDFRGEMLFSDDAIAESSPLLEALAAQPKAPQPAAPSAATP